jgi:cellulose synthase (UDP-forming)
MSFATTPSPTGGGSATQIVKSQVRRARASSATVESGSTIAGWARLLGSPRPEPRRSRLLAHIGGLTANATRAQAAPLSHPPAGIDCRAPQPVTALPDGMRVAVLIPTYNEPVEVIAPTIAAACALAPAHETWVLDDGDRDWVRALSEAYGARYMRRSVYDHAKAGNLNHTLELMAQQAAEGRDDVDVIAVLDCDHVPLPSFLTATLGWFDDPEVALVQGPQTFYNAGAFDDDGVTGEQGVFFHVLMAARNHDGAGPFWCGSTSLLRTRALREVGGIATDTIVEDMHTTLGLIKVGWKTVYHHQTLAVGLAPATPEQYLVQRRRWGLGSMQVLTLERLWAAKRWMSWRNYFEYLSGTLWWLEVEATIIVFLNPAIIMVSGAQTSTAGPGTFAAVFLAMFAVRMWGVRQLFRHHLHLPTAFALRIFRIPVGVSCLWWLVTRRSLEFAVTPKAGVHERLRGRPPRVVIALIVAVFALLGYSAAGALGWVPWRATAGATVASGIWLLLAGVGLLLGVVRVMSPAYATSRRNAHRIAVRSRVSLDGVDGELVDISVGGAAVRFPTGGAPVAEHVELSLPRAAPVRMSVVRTSTEPSGTNDIVSMRLADGDWEGFRTMCLWLFHTPAGALDGVPPGVPVVAATRPRRTSRRLGSLIADEPLGTS